MRRLTFAVLSAIAIAAGAVLAQPAQQPAGATLVLYAATGPDLATWSVNAADGTLTKSSNAALPFAVQYVWPHPTRRFLYVAWSNGMQGDRHGVSAFRVDAATGALTPHGKAIEIRHRPVHLTLDADATHVLVAYNRPSSLSVHAINEDGTLGAEVRQSADLDGGVYAHQIRVHPSNRMVVMVTRGNGPAPDRPEDPGALKIYGYRDGVLANRQSIAPNGGFGYQPRHIDFHPTQPFVYLNLERQNQLQVYRTAGESVEPKPLFTKNTLDRPGESKPAQMTGAIHVHPNGRFLYLSNRASGTTRTPAGAQVWEGGENTIGVYALDQKTGEPTRIQNIDSGGMHARTFTLDADAGLLVAANMAGVTKADGARVPPSLAVFRMGGDGRLTFVRKYDVPEGQGGGLMWAGFLRLPATIPAMTQDRLPPMPADTQTPEQRKASEAFRANRMQDVFGPFVPLLRSPEVMLRAMALGDHLRYRTVFPTKLNELIILVTARHFTQRYEWYVHYPIAIKEGLKRDIADAIADGRRPAGMDADETLIYDFCTELLRNNSVSDPTYARAVERFGEKGTIEMVGVVGYYTFQSMVLNTARTPVPAGAPPLRTLP